MFQIAGSTSTRSGGCRSHDAKSQKNGGARRDRTDDLMLAKHALSQLSYGPDRCRLRIKHPRRSLARPDGRRAAWREKPEATDVAAGVRGHPNNGGPGTTRTSDLTLIRGAL